MHNEWTFKSYFVP